MISSVHPLLLSTSFYVPLVSTKMTVWGKGPCDFFLLRNLKSQNSDHLFSAFFFSYQELLCILSFNLPFNLPSILTAFLMWTLKECTIILGCQVLLSRCIELETTSKSFFYRFICFAEHNINPAEILNHAEVRSGVSETTLDKQDF